MKKMIVNMAEMPRAVLRHNETGKFLVSATGRGGVETTTEKLKAKRFGSMNGASKFIENEDLEEGWIPTPL